MARYNLNNEIQPLSKLCTRIIAKNLRYKKYDDLKCLSNYVKYEILKIAIRVYGGICDNITLGDLLYGSLKRLNLSSSKINDETLYLIGNKCPNLEILQIDGKFSTLNKEALLVNIPKFTRLIELQLKNCDGIDVDVLTEIANSCTYLKILDLFGCKNVNDDCFQAFEKLKLIGLNLSETGITDEFLKKLGASILSNLLEDINLNNCQITCNGLKHLKWAKIKYIGFRGCEVKNLDFISDAKSLINLECTIK